MLIKNATLMTPQGEVTGWLRWTGSTIQTMGAGTSPGFDGDDVIDAEGYTLLPGFVDLHIHGCMGAEAMDATPEALQTMARFIAQHGVTSFLATTWTDAHERVLAALKNIAAMCGPQQDGAALLGAHVEGPYLNPKKCGAQSTEHIRRATRKEALPWLETGTIRLMALAPEFPENHWLIQTCAARGIAVSAAHTEATYDDIRLAISLGVTQATHTYNAMTGLHHREPGTLGAVLTSPEIRCELIADNIHVHPVAMDLLWRVKGPKGVILITDAIRGTGMPDGEYPVDDRFIIVKGGSARLPDGTLAGSTLTMDVALKNLIQATGAPLSKTWMATSLNAARAIGVAHRKGSLEINKDADLVLVDDKLDVMLTVAEGRVVYRSPDFNTILAV